MREGEPRAGLEALLLKPILTSPPELRPGPACNSIQKTRKKSRKFSKEEAKRSPEQKKRPAGLEALLRVVLVQRGDDRVVDDVPRLAVARDEHAHARPARRARGLRASTAWARGRPDPLAEYGRQSTHVSL